jgi:cation:H+ antiporter
MTAFMLVAGLVLLVLGAEALVRGASGLALSAGISPLVVGLTIVAYGTSAPEVAVSVGAALSGASDLAVGNVVGSNIFNVLFILGASALITPLSVHQQLIRQEVPIMIGASALLVAMAWDGNVGTIEAAVFALLAIAYTVFLVVQARRDPPSAEAEGPEAPGGWQSHPLAQVAMVAVGLGLLVLGARWLVASAVDIAHALGVSDLVIGLTIVAAGTSLPEVATSITAAIRGQRDIAVGNVVGSNIFNIFGCLGASGLVSADGLAVAPGLLAFDLWVMLAVAAVCLPVFFTGREIARWEGVVFLAYYVFYMAYLVLDAQGHHAAEHVGLAMVGFLVPLAAALGVSLWRESRTAGVPDRLDRT